MARTNPRGRPRLRHDRLVEAVLLGSVTGGVTFGLLYGTLGLLVLVGISAPSVSDALYALPMSLILGVWLGVFATIVYAIGVTLVGTPVWLAAHSLGLVSPYWAFAFGFALSGMVCLAVADHEAMAEPKILVEALWLIGSVATGGGAAGLVIRAVAYAAVKPPPAPHA